MFFSLILAFSVLSAISSSYWLMVWVTMEISVLSFIVVMVASDSGQESEAGGKYFLSQAVGSVMLLLGGVCFQLSPMFCSFMVCFGVLMKAGMAPSHFWFPQVMACVSWPSCLILSTWQKLIPVFILFHLSCFNSVVVVSCALSAFYGAVGSMGQSHMRPLMAYSSIGHMGWMVGSSSVSNGVGLNYLCSYILIIVPLFLIFWGVNMKSFSVPESAVWGGASRVSVMALILSLGGLPPLFGFFPKMFSIFCLFQTLLITAVLIAASVVTIYVYLNIFFCGLMNSRSVGSLEDIPNYHFFTVAGTVGAGCFQIFMVLNLLLVSSLYFAPNC